LNKSKYKIILLGERSITNCKEHKIHETYSIYDDCIKYLNNYIDETIEDSTKNNNIKDLLKTFNILNKSKLNIFISNSGIRHIILYTSNNVLGLTNFDQYIDNNLLHLDKNITLCNNINMLLYMLYKRI